MKTGNKVKDFANKVLFRYNDKQYTYDTLFTMLRKEIQYDKSQCCDWKILDVIDTNNNHAILLAFQDTHREKYFDNDTICHILANNEDWIHNLMFFPKKVKAYKNWENKLYFHYGFFQEYQMARDEILRELTKRIDNINTKIFVAGWSLGGSIAPIACEDIFYHFSIRPTMITYEGAVSCSTKHTKDIVLKALSDDSICFVNGLDIVPRVPVFPFGWKLKPLIYYFKADKRFPRRKDYSTFKQWIYNVREYFADYHRDIGKAIETNMPREITI